MDKFRKPELEQYKTIWITKEVYDILRDQKKKQRVSMAKVIHNLVLEKYARNSR